MQPTPATHPRAPHRERRFASWLTCFVAIASFGSWNDRALSAQDREEILSYDVRIHVLDDASLRVSEEITVLALGHEIQRGIFRDFPTTFPRAFGLARIEAPFDVLTVARNGSPEPYTTERVDGPAGRAGVRVRIGDPRVVLEPGVHRYRIEYATDRWVDLTDAGGRLEWNVTGNGWSFPIRQAAATVHVAGLADEPVLAAWTGPDGSTASDAEIGWDADDGVAVFTTTRPLSPGEGLTVRVDFPAGVLTGPSEAQEAAWVRMDWGGYIDAGYVVLLVIAAYLLMWRRVGIDPPPGPRRLRTDPPEGYSPAALGFIEKRGYDHQHFAATLVSMATKGALRLDRSGEDWVIHREDADVDLTPEERAVFDALLGSRETFRVSSSQHATIAEAMKKLRAVLSKRLERVYFHNNRGWFLFGLGISVAGLGVLAWRWRAWIDEPAWFLAVWLTLWSAGVVTMLYRAFTELGNARRTGDKSQKAGAIGLLFFSIPFVAAEIFVAVMLFRMVPAHLVLAAIAVGVTNVVFYHLLERPTLRGRGVLDQLQGFRSYLSDGDASRRYKGAGDPARLFERNLPYAIALGVEAQWAEGFAEVLRPRADGGRTVVPWYTHSSGGDDVGSFSSSLGASLTSTLSAASSPPGGGGSGGGGGSSGGGGGGGGGGGW